MPNYTTNYNLKKPLQEEFYNIDDHNGNMDIIDAELKKRASLDENGKVLPDQLPSMNYVPTSEKGKANGVATLDESGKVPSSQLPDDAGGSGKRTVRFTVGSSQYGWTASDCDYLCDGTADDVEINAAIQALRTTGGEIVLLDGLYNIKSAILVNKSGVTLTGNGGSTKIIRAFNDDEYDAEQGLVVIKNSFCTIKNIYFDGVKSGYYSNTAINLNSGDNCTISNNTIVNITTDGIYADGDHHIIENNIITDCGNIGLYLSGCNKATITNNQIMRSEAYGMYLYNVNDAVVNDNICMDCKDSGISLQNCNTTCFSGNILNGNSQNGIYLPDGDSNIICGNTFIENKNFGVYLNSLANKNVVMSNVYTSNTRGDVKNDGTNNIIHLPDHEHDGGDITSGFDTLAANLGIPKLATGSYIGDGTGVNDAAYNGSAAAREPLWLTCEYRTIQLPFVPKVILLFTETLNINEGKDVTYEMFQGGFTNLKVSTNLYWSVARLKDNELQVVYIAGARNADGSISGSNVKGPNVSGEVYHWLCF